MSAVEAKLISHYMVCWSLNLYKMLRKDVNNANNILKHESRNHKGSCTILLLLLYNSVIIIVQFRAHWQLFVLHPRENTVVWFCSLRKKPDINIKGAINSAMKTITSSFEGMSNQGAPRWVEPKTNVQSGGFECGYYVMHWMWCTSGFLMAHR
ncbi:uncharacterized protein LOC114392364 [Glycine soja]|uniref:uncharacterized protein LOC114392364 n=1 Tax=Glycine soja TaxID=3848 RepID=UPI00103A7C09|nr:uncharacterized protein LOC114392364 [Glycine soja]